MKNLTDKSFVSKAFILPILFLVISFFSTPSWSQDAPIQWDIIDPNDLLMTVYDLDSTAEAVVLANYGHVYIYSSLTEYGYNRFQHKRIKILTKSGFDQGDVMIPYYHKDQLEEMREIHAQIILPSGKKIVLDKKDFFVEKLNSRWSAVKFTYPNMVEGAIIEYKYTLNSKYMQEITPWYFEENIPVRYSEYRIKNTSRFTYMSLFEGGEHMDKKTMVDGSTIFEKDNTRFELWDSRYILHNGQALKKEAFITTMNDYRSRVRFQLSEYIDIYGNKTQHMSTWPKLAEDLIESSSFGEQYLKKRNYKKLLKATEPLVGESMTEAETASTVFSFLSQNMTWNERYGIYTSQNLDKAYAAKTATAAELNLMCIALLNAYGLDAKPVLTSTRSHGKMTDSYPLVDQFNHVLVLLTYMDGSTAILDVAHELLPMGLPRTSALNGQGWLVDKENPIWLALAAPTCRDFVGIRLKVDEAGNMDGELKATFHNYSAFSERISLKEDPEGSFWKNRLGYGEDVEIKNLNHKNLDNLNKKLVSTADFHIPNEEEPIADFIYFNPIIYSSFSENPFKSETRQYMVDFPYPFEEKILMEIELPSGYEIEELPEPMNIKLPKGAANFSYFVEDKGEKVQILYKITINRTKYVPEEYKELKNLFDQMMETRGEPIVLRKKTEYHSGNR